MANELPTWCNESPVTNSYVAGACPYDYDPLREPLDTTGQLFRQSTDAFLNWIEEEEPLALGRLDFTRASAWHSLSGQLVTRYKRSHWQLLASDPTYRDALGEAVDTYNLSAAQPRKRVETLAKQKNRYIQQGQELISEAAQEGLATAVAVYSVVPGVVRLRKPILPKEQQAQASESLLPAAAEFSRHLARQSKRGNARLLRSLAGISGLGHIHYPTLTYQPETLALTTDGRGRDILTTIDTHYESTDLQERFRGCPALLYGSITKINKLLAQIIIENNCYERAFA